MVPIDALLTLKTFGVLEASGDSIVFETVLVFEIAL